MKAYQASSRYHLMLGIGMFVSIPMIFCGVISLLVGFFFAALYFLLPGIFVFYLVIFVFPKNITLYEDSFLYQTAFLKLKLKYSEIKTIKPYYSTRQLTMAGGDKTKAEMLCILRILNKPLILLVFGRSITEYKELYEKLVVINQQLRTN